ncbi:hypothetical protein ABBQ38_008522 [Trebouxia sp. C0009 RCD-2024]
MTSDLLPHSLQGAQIALQLQAAEQAQQQQQQQQADGASAVAGTHTITAMTQPVSANQAEIGSLPHQATGPAGEANIAYEQHQLLPALALIHMQRISRLDYSSGSSSSSRRSNCPMSRWGALSAVGGGELSMSRAEFDDATRKHTY